MLEEDITELGTDIISTWEFKDGDLVLVNNDTNLVQSIVNRLNCEYDSLDAFYYEYGTSLSSFLGFKASNETLEFIKIEINETLQQDPRINEFDVEAEYNDKNEVLLYISILFNEDSELELSLVISEDGTVIINEEGGNFGSE